MRCKYCDCENRPGRNICESCGAPLDPPVEIEKRAEDVQAEDVQDFPEVAPYDVPDYLPHSILVTLFCCLPLGVVAIIFASKSKALLHKREYALAVEAAERAKYLSLISFGLGFVFFLFNVVGMLITMITEGM